MADPLTFYEPGLPSSHMPSRRPAGTTTVLLVDDEAVARAGMAAVLSAAAGIDVVAETATLEHALREVARLKPHVVVIEMRTGNLATAVVEAMRHRHARTRVVAITSAPTDRLILDTFAAGARAFLTKESDPSLLLDAVCTVTRGETYVDPKIAAKLVALATNGRRTKGPYGLTQQEMRVVELLPRRLTNRQIGQELGLSEETVKSHLRHAMAKLGVHDRSEAARLAVSEGIV